MEKNENNLLLFEEKSRSLKSSQIECNDFCGQLESIFSEKTENYLKQSNFMLN